MERRAFLKWLGVAPAAVPLIAATAPAAVAPRIAAPPPAAPPLLDGVSNEDLAGLLENPEKWANEMAVRTLVRIRQVGGPAPMVAASWAPDPNDPEFRL